MAMNTMEACSQSSTSTEPAVPYAGNACQDELHSQADEWRLIAAMIDSSTYDRHSSSTQSYALYYHKADAKKPPMCVQ